jgi:hypothetical protein
MTAMPVRWLASMRRVPRAIDVAGAFVYCHCEGMQLALVTGLLCLSGVD